MTWFALSFEAEVEKYGAYAGIASFLGLAVLSLLYFAQARELKRLREWAGRAPERARELEARVVAEAASRAVPAEGETAATVTPPRRLAEMPPPPPTGAQAAPGSATELADPPTGAEAVANGSGAGDNGAAPPAGAEQAAPSPNGAQPPAREDGEPLPDGAPAAVAAGDAQEPAPPADTAVVAAAAAGAAAAAAAGPPAEPSATLGADGSPGDPAVAQPAARAGGSPGDPAVAQPAAASPGLPGDPAGTQPEARAAGSPGAPSVAPGAGPGEPGHGVAAFPADPSVAQPAAGSPGAPSVPAGGTAPPAARAAGSPGTSAAGEPAAPAGPEQGPPIPVPRATPAQRVGVTPRPAPMPLRQAQPSAVAGGRGKARRPGAPVPRGAAPPARSGRSAGTIALLVGLAVLILGGGAFALSQLGGDDPATQPNRPAEPATQAGTGADPGGGGTAAGTAAAPPAETNVAVFNGTTFTGLAGQLADRVEREGYQRGLTETYTQDQARQASTVFYADGFRVRARDVARLLSISDVEPLDADTRALAPEAEVVVLAGADQAP